MRVSPRQVRLLLLALAAADATRAAVALAAPDLWFRWLHGTLYFDPQGLLRRIGAAWLMAAIAEGVAAWRARRETLWLPLVAGVRSTELFSDWVYLACAQRLTPGASVYLITAPIANAAAVLLLVAAQRRLGAPAPGLRLAGAGERRRGG
jgi:hypothetical protein